MMNLTALTKSKRTSPLRYPGGKHVLAPYVAGVIEENFLTGCTLYEPFAGSAAVSLELLRLGYVDRSVLVERDPLMYAFWHCVKHEFESLCSAVEDIDVSINTWRKFEPLRHVDDPFQSEYSLLQLGLGALFFNRTNFSGVIGAGPIGGASQKSKYKIDCRFNKAAVIAGLRGLNSLAPSIEPFFGDALSWFESVNHDDLCKNAFVYVDPPYFTQGKKLYRYSFDNSQHLRLANALTSAVYPWLLSYDDAPFVRDLYLKSNVQSIYLDYSVKSSRLANEIVISNLCIPPPVYEGISNTSGIDIQGDISEEVNVA